MFRYLPARVLCAALAFCLAVLVFQAEASKRATDSQRVGAKGRIDWEKGFVYATGLGPVSAKETNAAKAYVRARRFAEMDAQRAMLITLDHIRIDSQSTGKDFETINDTIQAEVQGIVRGSRVVSEREVRIRGNSLIEVTIAVPLYGEESVARVFLPEASRRAMESDGPAPLPRLPAPQVEEPSLPSHEEDTAPVLEEGRPYTGVIIDTRGLHIERSMCPKILRRDGSEVWGTVEVSPDYVLDHGIVVYARTMEIARKMLDRAGNNPLILKAVARGNGRFPSDAILSDADAERLLAANRRGNFLGKYRVIFVVDPARPLL